MGCFQQHSMQSLIYHSHEVKCFPLNYDNKALTDKSGGRKGRYKKETIRKGAFHHIYFVFQPSSQTLWPHQLIL